MRNSYKYAYCNKEQANKGGQKIILGLLEGKINISNDFNEPLDDLKEHM